MNRSMPNVADSLIARLRPWRRALLIVLLVTFAAATASARTPQIRGTLPVQNGELVGNTVMFVGYDLADDGTTPKAEVVDDTANSAVPIRVTSRCKKGRTSSAPRRCNVVLRLMKWTVGHHYRAVLHKHTLNFTIIAGDPGMTSKRPSKRPSERPNAATKKR